MYSKCARPIAIVNFGTKIDSGIREYFKTRETFTLAEAASNHFELKRFWHFNCGLNEIYRFYQEKLAQSIDEFRGYDGLMKLQGRQGRVRLTRFPLETESGKAACRESTVYIASVLSHNIKPWIAGRV